MRAGAALFGTSSLDARTAPADAGEGRLNIKNNDGHRTVDFCFGRTHFRHFFKMSIFRFLGTIPEVFRECRFGGLKSTATIITLACCTPSDDGASCSSPAHSLAHRTACREMYVRAVLTMAARAKSCASDTSPLSDPLAPKGQGLANALCACFCGVEPVMKDCRPSARTRLGPFRLSEATTHGFMLRSRVVSCRPTHSGRVSSWLRRLHSARLRCGSLSFLCRGGLRSLVSVVLVLRQRLRTSPLAARFRK